MESLRPTSAASSKARNFRGRSCSTRSTLSPRPSTYSRIGGAAVVELLSSKEQVEPCHHEIKRYCVLPAGHLGECLSRREASLVETTPNPDERGRVTIVTNEAGDCVAVTR